MATSTAEQRFVTEIPSSLKQLARLVVRGFYTLEDALIIDMLVRNPCMKEDDISELLKFEKKQMRSRISTLKNDKFLQVRLKMETGPDGKAQKVNYYFINYKTFVNVVKYKLDLMRKRMETEERDATSRASFKCSNCTKTFTDLEADQLFDFNTSEFRCTFCGCGVEEDMSAMPKKDSRLLLAKFNEQLQPLYDLLRDVEGIKLAPELLEPEPVDLDTIRGITKPTLRPDGFAWSGEATRNQGFAVEETRVDVTINDSNSIEIETTRKDRPIWMTESTVISNEGGSKNLNNNADSILQLAAQTSLLNSAAAAANSNVRNRKETEDIMSVLLQHEKHPSTSDSVNALEGLRQSNTANNSSESSDDENGVAENHSPKVGFLTNSESEDDIPTVYVAGRPYPVDEINSALIAKMTRQEKDNYILVYQEHFSHIYD